MFYTRVQVPKELQASLGKKEYWISLGTSDRDVAIKRAFDSVKKKRNEIDLELRRSRKEYRLVSDLSDEEVVALGREIYEHLHHHLSTIPRMEAWNYFNSKPTLDFGDSVSTQPTELPDFVKQFVELNLLKINEGSNAFFKVIKIANDVITQLKNEFGATQIHETASSGNSAIFIDPKYRNTK
ncbi:MAG: hypothetical protein GXP05_11520 [Alphaproteobacteria bacterium]|nr:hypothetical protein [Alphaproteobacteria bacterium]